MMRFTKKFRIRYYTKNITKKRYNYNSIKNSVTIDTAFVTNMNELVDYININNDNIDIKLLKIIEFIEKNFPFIPLFFNHQIINKHYYGERILKIKKIDTNTNWRSEDWYIKDISRSFVHIFLRIWLSMRQRPYEV
jgi:hypothetical protein